MSLKCTDCGGLIKLPNNACIGEIIECSDCGLEYIVAETDNGMLTLKELTLKGEDWGE